jgi:DNA-binding beta-propeller fold protein YncE
MSIYAVESQMFFNVETFAGTIDFVGNSLDIEKNPGDGPAAQATLFVPFGLTITPSGVVYVTEPLFNGIRKIEGGVVSTLASRKDGNADGPLSTALFSGPTGIVSDQAGNLYVSDQSNQRIRKIDTAGNVTTIAGPSGPETPSGWVDDLPDQARFSRPRALALDAADNSLYLCEHDRIRNIPLSFFPSRMSMEVRTVAAVVLKGFGDGPPLLAQFDSPSGLAVSQTGDLFVADTNNFRIRRVSPSGTVTTIAGDGVPAVPTDAAQFADNRPALQARFERPTGIAVDETGKVWVTDGAHLRMYQPRSGLVFTACSDQRLHQQPVTFTRTAGIALSKGNIFVIDAGKVMLVTPHQD